MGRPMAARLADAAFPLHAWNRSIAKARALATHGARVCESPAEAVRGVEIVVSMLEAGRTMRRYCWRWNGSIRE